MDQEPQHTAAPAPRPRRRSRLVAGGVASVALVAGGAVVALRGLDDSPDASTDGGSGSSGTKTSTAEIAKRDLENHDELNGTLGYGDPEELTSQAQGTITALPALGTVVQRGQSLAEVDGHALTLWYGDRPLWRQLDSSADDGLDVQEVEANLVALGYATASTLTVDQNWTSATTTAVKKWQKAQGKEQTGTVAPGDVVMLPGAIRIAEQPTAVGAQAGGPIAKVTSADRVVTMDLEATKQSLVKKNLPVEVELPDGTILKGKVTEIGTVAESDPEDPQATPTIGVTVSLDDPSKAGSLDQAPVTVRVVTSAAKDVLAVPVEALLALAEGGYAVEKVTGTTSKLVAVETGAFADGYVEVTGTGLKEGDKVKVPAT
jgi:hypothetical protein